MEYDTDKVDEATLALLYLNLFEDRWGARAWKSMPWEAMDRLQEKGLIGHPKSKADVGNAEKLTQANNIC